MQIGILTHNLKQDNGSGVLSLRLAKGLEKQGRSEIIALTAEGSGLGFERPILYPRRLKLLANFFIIRRILKTCEVIHAFDAYPYGVIAVIFSLGLRKKVVITAVGSGSIIPLYQPFISWLIKRCYQRADVVTAISNYTKHEILKKISGLEIKVINPGVDLEEFFEAAGKLLPPEVRQYQPYILSVGALRWRKGYKLSIPAFAEVNKKFPDLKYVIIGKKYTDKYLNQLREIIRDLGLEKKVIIIENMPREKLLQFYRGAELFCLMSQNLGHDVEGFGIVFLEAAASGLPVVGAKDSGIEDAVLEGKNGFLVESRDPYAFAEAIIKILSNEQLKKQMSEYSFTLAKESQWDIRIDEYISLLQLL